jgi:hypothetical protein
MAKNTKIVVADTPEELDAATRAVTPKIEDVPSSAPLTITDAGDEGRQHSLRELNEARKEIFDKQRGIFPAASEVRYESRIRISEAWQYNGVLAEAPAWVDRSWAAWDDGDGTRRILPGPALRVPSPTVPTGSKLCRRGDYVVRQEVTIALGLEPDIQVEVWPREEFERFFLPRKDGGEALAASGPPASPETKEALP